MIESNNQNNSRIEKKKMNNTIVNIIKSDSTCKN